MKIDWLNLKKIIIDTVRGGQFLYITLKFDYKFNFGLLQYFSLNFSIIYSQSPYFILYYLPLSSPLSTCRSNC